MGGGEGGGKGRERERGRERAAHEYYPNTPGCAECLKSLLSRSRCKCPHTGAVLHRTKDDCQTADEKEHNYTDDSQRSKIRNVKGVSSTESLPRLEHKERLERGQKRGSLAPLKGCVQCLVSHGHPSLRSLTNQWSQSKPDLHLILDQSRLNAPAPNRILGATRP